VTLKLVIQIMLSHFADYLSSTPVLGASSTPSSSSRSSLSSSLRLNHNADHQCHTNSNTVNVIDIIPNRTVNSSIPDRVSISSNRLTSTSFLHVCENPADTKVNSSNRRPPLNSFRLLPTSFLPTSFFHMREIGTPSSSPEPMSAEMHEEHARKFKQEIYERNGFGRDVDLKGWQDDLADLQRRCFVEDDKKACLVRGNKLLGCSGNVLWRMTRRRAW
jgi:hypothetical protein